MTKKKKVLQKQVAGNHYKELPIEPIEFILGNNLSYCCGNAIKYISRDKGSRVDDLRKAIHYLENELHHAEDISIRSGEGIPIPLRDTEQLKSTLQKQAEEFDR